MNSRYNPIANFSKGMEMSFSNDQVGVLQAMGIDVWRSNDITTQAIVSDTTVDDRVYSVMQTKCQVSGASWLWLLGETEPTEPELVLFKKIAQAVKLHVIDHQSVSLSQIQQLQPEVLVVLGVSVSGFISEEKQTISVGWQGQHELCQRVLVTHALSDMLDQPACKKIVWRDLQALQSAVSGG